MLPPASLSRRGYIHSSLFFFLALLFFFPVLRASGCSRILRTSSSVIFLSVWNFSRSRGWGPPSLVMPFLVMAGYRCELLEYNSLSHVPHATTREGNEMGFVLTNCR